MFKDVEKIPDFPALEREILKFWEMERPFAQRVKKNRGKKRWSFYDGPITANNPMGVHHAWGRTFKDIFQRHRAMLGYDQRYQNGFDCQGLWVEVEVEKELSLDSKREIVQYGLENFAQRCKERVTRYARRQTEQSIRLGQWMDWDNSYYTMSDRNIETIWRFLKRCHDQGWLYRGRRSMPWCWRCGTPLSQHELADSYDDLTHQAVFLKLPTDGPFRESLLVWTTTPWTLTANTALAVHPELTYLRVKQGDEILILAEGAKGCLAGPYEVEGRMKGEELVGLAYTGPLHVGPRQGLPLRVIPWKAVGATEGTGIVHIAPGCGAEDFELSKLHGLEVLVPIDEDGHFLPAYEPFAGKHALEAPELVFAELKRNGYLYKVEPYTHRYPVCWRCKKELVFRVADVWFIAVNEIRPRLIEEARKVRWIPEYAGKRMENWLESMGDWCISRNRFWGLPLPFYPCRCGETTIVGSQAELRELAAAGAEGLKELHRPWIDAVKIRCPQCGEAVERIQEVGDCWLDAGIIPFSTIGWGEDPEHWQAWFPAEFITEMVEQVRLWFYATLFMSVTLEDRAPYRAVLTYESVTDENGERFSKTKGNAIPFDEAAERMGSDVMRWLFASVSTERNLRFGYGLATEVKRKLLTLWNVYAFFVLYATHDRPEKLGDPLSTPALTDVDRWILCRLSELVRVSRSGLENYDTATLTREVERFLDDLSNWYVRRSRDRFWKSEDDKDKKVAYRTLYRVLKTLLQLLAPVLPFLTEKIWQNLVRHAEPDAPASVHLTDYPEPDPAFVERGLIQAMEAVSQVCQLGHAIRATAGIKVRQPLREVIVRADSPTLERGLQTFSTLIQQELNVKAVKLLPDLSAIQTYKVKPNFKLLGRKYGARLAEVQAALEAADPREVARRALAGERVELSSNSTVVALEPEEVLVERGYPAHLAALEDHGLVVCLSTRITPELRREGLVSDLKRHVQVLRKDAGYQIADRIVLEVAGADAELRAAIAEHEEEIRRDTLAVRVDLVERVGGELTREVKVGDQSVWIGVSRRI